MTIQLGQILAGRYRVDALLGQGGFGAVYRVWDVNLNRPRALKENLDASPEAQRQFGREAGMLADLSHPNLPRVLDYFFILGYGQYLVMDFIEGEDLQAMLNRARRPLPESQVVEWMNQISGALAYLHAQQPPIVHRDVKPANIKITPTGRAVLVDFGIAKVFDAALRTTIGAKAVTPGYSPPEQYGQGTTDPRSDVYALGATLYALVTDQEPIESVTRFSGQTLKPPSAINPAVSSRLDSAILRAMKLDPAERFQAVTDLKGAMTALQVGRNGSTNQWSQAWRGWVAGAFALGLVMGWGGGQVISLTAASTQTATVATQVPLPVGAVSSSPMLPGVATAVRTDRATSTLRPTLAPTTVTVSPTATTPQCPGDRFWDPAMSRCQGTGGSAITVTVSPTATIPQCPSGQFWDPAMSRCRGIGGSASTLPPR